MTPDLEELLADGLARYAETVSMPDGQLRAARTRRRRRLIMRACTAGATGLAVAVATMALVGGPHGEPQMLTDAYVVSQVQVALTAAESNDGMVMHATSQDTLWAKGGEAAWKQAWGPTAGDPLWTKDVQWSYRNEELIEPYSIQGTVQGEQADIVSPGTLTEVGVDYTTHTWSRDQWRIGTGGLPSPSAHGQLFLPPSCKGEGYSVLSDLSWPAYLRSALSCGDLRYAGKATLNGRQVLMLDNVPSRGVRDVAETLWVDPRTYLPVRELWQLIPGSVAGYILPGAFDPVQTDFQWLPPTPANIAHATVSIPAGFRETH
jgi:hypothetical protein